MGGRDCYYCDLFPMIIVLICLSPILLVVMIYKWITEGRPWNK
jgi:hypothetical protein